MLSEERSMLKSGREMVVVRSQERTTEKRRRQKLKYANPKALSFDRRGKSPSGSSRVRIGTVGVSLSDGRLREPARPRLINERRHIMKSAGGNE